MLRARKKFIYFCVFVGSSSVINDELSDISDDEFMEQSDKGDTLHRLSVRPTSNPRIQSLFYDTEKV